MALALTNTRPITSDMSIEAQYRAAFDPCIRPDMKSSWENIWKNWIVTTDDPLDIRKPGKLKYE